MGRKISKEEFYKNYTSAPKSGAEHRRRKKWSIQKNMKKEAETIEYETEEIYNPIYLYYTSLERVTDKAFCFKFGDGSTHWFPKAYCRIYSRIGAITVPTVFARERKLLGFKL